MIALPDITIQDKIYESLQSLLCRGIGAQDGRALCFADTARGVVKQIRQYPSPQELTRYRQEYAITRSLDLEGVVKAYSHMLLNHAANSHSGY